MTVAVPALTAVTVPSAATSAMDSSEVVQVIAEAVPEGSVAFTRVSCSSPRVTDLVTLTLDGAFFTVTLQVAFLPL